MTEKILILDFGSQFTQLIARAVREANVFCEIIPFQKAFTIEPGLKGIILSGSPFSVNEENAPSVDIAAFIEKVTVLGVCYGAQLTAKLMGGKVDKSNKREYGRAKLHIQKEDILWKNVSEQSQVWMSHSDSITALPEGFEILATTESIPVEGLKKTSGSSKPLYGIQFHPEVYHSVEGKKIINNFLIDICGCKQDWTPASFVAETVAKLKAQIGDSHVIMALSGGVDSTVAAKRADRLELIQHRLAELTATRADAFPVPLLLVEVERGVRSADCVRDLVGELVERESGNRRVRDCLAGGTHVGASCTRDCRG